MDASPQTLQDAPRDDLAEHDLWCLMDTSVVSRALLTYDTATEARRDAARLHMDDVRREARDSWAREHMQMSGEELDLWLSQDADF